MKSDADKPRIDGRGRAAWGLTSTGKQVELLLHIAALVLVEWILFQFLFRSISDLPPTRARVGNQRTVMLIMVAIAAFWGVPLFFMLRHTRLTLRSCLLFVTVMSVPDGRNQLSGVLSSKITRHRARHHSYSYSYSIILPLVLVLALVLDELTFKKDQAPTAARQNARPKEGLVSKRVLAAPIMIRYANCVCDARRGVRHRSCC